MPRLKPIFGYVYCDRHGAIHEDTLDPYDYGPSGMCEPENHKLVFAYFKPEELEKPKDEPKKRRGYARLS